MRALTIVVVLAALGLAAGPAAAASLEPIGNFSSPIYITSDPSDATRLFVVERNGLVDESRNGSARTFADLRAEVGCPLVGCDGERGLLSIALAPDFATSGRLFADYASELDGDIHVVELVARGGTALGATPRELIEIPHPGIKNHYAGQLEFGPEGDLFVSTGDGSAKDDQFHNAQDPESLLGKLLRIDPDDPDGAGPATYTVPADNPFVGKAGRDEIWSLGLRNPFRFSFDRLNGDLWIGDVGQGASEEVDLAPAPGLGRGANYGWNCVEGRLTGTVPPASLDPECEDLEASDLTAPVFDYPHEDPGGGAAHGCAVIGGYLVRDPSLGDLYGRYLYGDYCAPGELRSFDPADPDASDRSEGLTVGHVYSLGEDACGRVYAIGDGGAVSRLVGAPPRKCGEPGPPQPEPPPALRRAYAGIKAFSRRVQRGDRALITVWISPCAGRQGERIRLLRGHRGLGTRRLSRACTARFQPRIHRRAGFRARIGAGAGFAAATSRRLTIEPRRVHRHRGGSQRRAPQ